MKRLNGLISNFVGEQDWEMRLIFIFRYISLFCSTLFFLLEDRSQGLDSKIITAVCILISSSIIAYLYYKNRHDIRVLRMLVYIETVGNSIILLPTGGFNSPYLWYFINSILIASFYIGRVESLISGTLYILSSFVSIYIYEDHDFAALKKAISKQPNIILSIILMAGAVWIISSFVNKLKVEGNKLQKMNQKLELANGKASESMEEIMGLYQAMDVVFDKHDEDEIIKVLLNHTGRITKSREAFYRNSAGIFLTDSIDGEGEILKIKNELGCELDKLIYEGELGDKAREINIGVKKIAVMEIRSAYNHYGILGIDISDFCGDIISFQNINQLRFIAKLGSMALERCNVEKVNERLLVTEERNRIADEIHDSVLQHLFGMSCSVYGLMKNSEKMDNNQRINALNDIRRTTNNIMKELRETIYSMSWKKEGENTFIRDIESCIQRAENSMDVNIDLEVDEKHECLSVREKKAFYRIISEGIGNAIRHGMAKNITVDIFIDSFKKELCILDDGMGFSNEKFLSKEKKGGMGLKNIKSLACLLGGQANIKSLEGVGTEIKIIVPRELKVKGECRGI